MPDQAALTIGEVINLLKEEFPDVTVSKVRFLEDQGLLHPSRSRSGYRQFHEADLKRLRYILRLQRDQFLPLKVIKSKLTMWDRGEDAPGEDGSPASARDLAEPSGEYEEARLLAQSGLTERQLAQLSDHGLLPAQGPFHDAHIAVAIAAARLLGLGLEARHLRTALIAAERSADLLNTLTEPLRRHRTSEALQRAHETLTIGAESMEDLFRHYLAAELRGLLRQ